MESMEMWWSGGFLSLGLSELVVKEVGSTVGRILRQEA